MHLGEGDECGHREIEPDRQRERERVEKPANNTKKVSEDIQCYIATDSFHSTIRSFPFIVHSLYLFVYN